jgi:hypothetical protein
VNKTKWIPLCSYVSGYDNYIVLARKNLKTGMIYFKTKRINSRFADSCGSAAINLDINKQFNLLITENKKEE